MKEPKSHKSSKKHKKEKHSKKHKKHKKRERSSSTSSDSSSGSDGGPARGSALSQLERERAAVQAARYLLASQPAVRKSFREVCDALFMHGGELLRATSSRGCSCMACDRATLHAFARKHMVQTWYALVSEQHACGDVTAKQNTSVLPSSTPVAAP